MSDDEDEDFGSLRAELSRERSALVQKILLAKGKDSSPSNNNRRSIGRNQALLQSARALQSPSSPQKTPAFEPMSSPQRSRPVQQAQTSSSPERFKQSSNVDQPSPERSKQHSSPVQSQRKSDDPPQKTQHRQSIVKAAQIFGDTRLIQSVPQSLNAVDPNEDLRAKVLADQQYVQEKEAAKKERLREVLQAKPTAEQQSLPDAQRQRKTSIKALQLLGNQDLERQMQQNVANLPYDSKRPQNKATRVLGSVPLLGQPKLEKVLGTSTDAEDAQVRGQARDAWEREVSKRNSVTNRVLRTFASAASTTSTTTTVCQPPSQPQQRERSLRTFASNASTGGGGTSKGLQLVGSWRQNSNTETGQDMDRRIKQRQSKEETAELVSLMDRFGALGKT